MEGRGRVEWITFTALVILTRVGDGVTTKWATPDLAKEMNPVAAGGWPAMIAVAAAVVALSSFLHYLHLFRPVDNFPAEPGLDLASFKKHYFDPNKNAVLAGNPWGVVAHVFGYITPRTLILWSLLLIVNNVLTALELQPYVGWKRQYPVWVLFYLALPALALLLLERLQRKDFARYRARSAR